MTGDPGMAYELCGLVARPSVLDPAVRGLPARVVRLDQGLALVPVTPELTRSAAVIERPVPPESGFWRLTPGVVALLERGSLAGPIAYLEAEYWGRWGRQTAAVWDCGAIALGPRILGAREPFPATGGGPIGAALRRVGAVACGRRDEFVSLGLGRCRSTVAWARVLDWAAVRDRYARRPVVPALTGGSVLEVVDVDDEKICVRQRLWRDCVTRAQLETALTLLGPGGGTAVEFAEALRRHYSGGPQVQPGCSRIPNLCAVILKDLGFLTD